jgi:hypothetical protein
MTLNLDDFTKQLQALVNTYDPQQDFATYTAIEQELNRVSNAIIAARIALKEKKDAVRPARPVMSATQAFAYKRRGQL